MGGIKQTGSGSKKKQEEQRRKQEFAQQQRAKEDKLYANNPNYVLRDDPRLGLIYGGYDYKGNRVIAPSRWAQANEMYYRPLTDEEKYKREEEQHRKKMAEVDAQMKKQQEAADAMRRQSELQAQLAGDTREGRAESAEVSKGVGMDLENVGEDRKKRRRLTGASSLGIG